MHTHRRGAGVDGRWRRVFGFAALVLVWACGTDEDPVRESTTPIVVPVDEVHVVAAPGMLARVMDMQPTEDGRIWLLNSVEPFFVVVGADGTVEDTFGSAGGGPGEYGAPVGLVLGAGAGEVWTYDVPRHALRRIGPKADRDLPLPRDSLTPDRLVSFLGAGFRPAPPWMVGTPDGILMGGARASAAPWTGIRLWKADIFLVRTDAPAPVVEPRLAVADLLDDPAVRYPGATTFMPYPIWAICDDAGLRLYDPLGNAIRRFDRDGREGEPLSLPPERHVAVTFERVFGMFYRQFLDQAPASQTPDSAQMRAALEAQFPQIAATSADVLPEYADLRCTGRGTLWLAPFDPASPRMGQGPEWWRIEEDGSRAVFRFPEAFSPFRFAEDRVWGILVDSLGIPSAAWIDLRR